MIKAKKNIVWLASYPKSGNTWFRVFLSNLLGKSENPANINKLIDTTIASSRSEFDDITGIDSSMLTFSEIENLKPDVYRFVSSRKVGLSFKKVHDAYTINSNGDPVFPADASFMALYFIRNPLDVAVSFAYHNGVSFDNIIELMANPDYAFCNRKDRLANQLKQPLSTWSNHVISWTEQNEIPVHVIRYEDMVNNPYQTFQEAVSKLEIPATKEDIDKAIWHSDIKQLQEQEEKDGFKEKPRKNSKFFRKGIVGDHRNKLTDYQIAKIIHDHNEVMKMYGYYP